MGENEASQGERDGEDSRERRHNLPAPSKSGMAAGIAPEGIIPNPKLKLLGQIREVMRLKHYSIRTERCYSNWIRRYIHFHQMQRREELSIQPEAKIELFLSDLAVRGNVTASQHTRCSAAPIFAPSRNYLDTRMSRPL